MIVKTSDYENCENMIKESLDFKIEKTSIVGYYAMYHVASDSFRVTYGNLGTLITRYNTMLRAIDTQCGYNGLNRIEQSILLRKIWDEDLTYDESVWYAEKFIKYSDYYTGELRDNFRNPVYESYRS